MSEEHSSDHHHGGGRGGVDFNKADPRHGDGLSSSQQEGMGTPDRPGARGGGSSGGGGGGHHHDTEVRKYRARGNWLERIARANDPDAGRFNHQIIDGMLTAAMGGLLLGPIGAAAGFAATAVEMKYNGKYHCLADLPPEFLNYLELHSGIPFSEFPGHIKKLSWDALHTVFPDLTETVLFVLENLFGDFEEDYTKTVPAEHAWLADKKVAKSKEEIFADSVIASGPSKIADNPEIYAALMEAGKQVSKLVGRSGLAGQQQKYEIDRLGHIVGGVLNDNQHKISGNVISNFEMRERDPSGTVQVIKMKEMDLDADGIIRILRSREIGTEYELLKTSMEKAAATAPTPDAQAQPAPDPTTELQFRKMLSAKLPALVATAGMTSDELREMIGLGKDTKLSLNSSIYPGEQHFQLVYRDVSGGVKTPMLYEELASGNMEIVLQQVELVRGLKNLAAHGHGFTEAEILANLDTSSTESDGLRIDKGDPKLSINLKTLVLTGNFTNADGTYHELMEFDLGRGGVDKLIELVKKREQLVGIEEEIEGQKNAHIHQAMVAAVGGVIQKHHPGVTVTEDRDHTLHADSNQLKHVRLDQAANMDELTEAWRMAAVVAAHMQGSAPAPTTGKQDFHIEDAPPGSSPPSPRNRGGWGLN